MPKTPPPPPAAPPPTKNIELISDIDPVYSNMVRIVHSHSEIVLDFAQFLPGDPNPKVKAKVLMSPLGAKLFFRALAENIARYEATFGEITMPGSNSLAEKLFRTNEPTQET
jgi:hypothetical protein